MLRVLVQTRMNNECAKESPVPRPEARGGCHSIPFEGRRPRSHAAAASAALHCSALLQGEQQGGLDWTRQTRGDRRTPAGDRESRRARGGVPRRGGRAAERKMLSDAAATGAPATRVPSIIPCCLLPFSFCCYE